MITLFGKKTGCLAGFILVLLLVLPFSAQCAEADGPVVKRLAVIAFQPLLPAEGSTMVVCPLCSAGFSIGKIEKGAEKLVQESFIDKLRDVNYVKVLPPEKVMAVYNRVVVGATLKLLNAQPVGTYTGTFDVTINYY